MGWASVRLTGRRGSKGKRVASLVPVQRAKRKANERTVKSLAKALSYLDRRDVEKQEKGRQELLERWMAATKVALDTIYDLKIYPDENHGAVGQPTSTFGQ